MPNWCGIKPVHYQNISHIILQLAYASIWYVQFGFRHSQNRKLSINKPSPLYTKVIFLKLCLLLETPFPQSKTFLSGGSGDILVGFFPLFFCPTVLNLPSVILYLPFLKKLFISNFTCPIVMQGF